MVLEAYCHTTLPSKHLMVCKTSSRRLQDMSWRRLQHVFSIIIFRLPRLLENILKTSRKTSWRHLKTSWRRLGRRKIATLKMSWRHVLKTSWKHPEDMFWRHLQNVLETKNGNICSVYLTSLYFTNLYLTNPKSLIRTQ